MGKEEAKITDELMEFYKWVLNLNSYQTNQEDLNKAGFQDLRDAVKFWELNHAAFVKEFQCQGRTGNVLNNIEDSINNCKIFLEVGPEKYQELSDEFMESLLADL